MRVAEAPAQCTSQGSGPPLLLLHGDGENASDWQRVLSQRATTHSVFAPNLPGFDGDYKPTKMSHVPQAWIAEQYRLAQTPGCLQTALAALRAVLDLGGQREVLLHQLPELQMPTCIIWGEQDRVVPISQAQEGAALLKHGLLVSITECGHLPHVEQPDRFAIALSRFLNASRRASYA